MYMYLADKCEDPFIRYWGGGGEFAPTPFEYTSALSMIK